MERWEVFVTLGLILGVVLEVYVLFSNWNSSIIVVLK